MSFAHVLIIILIFVLVLVLPKRVVDGVRWAHAVNTSRKLDKALDDIGVDMIEADIVVSRTNDIVMAHPPKRHSDLTFHSFLMRVTKAVNQGRRVGIKLDFKDANAVEPCLRLLRRPNFPVWLNADVIKGPGGREPIPARTFVMQCSHMSPDATLSLGWTHTLTPILGYTEHMIMEMLELTRGTRQHVTYAISAAHLYASDEMVVDTLLAYIDGSNSRSLTLWGPITPSVERWYRERLPSSKTYVDGRPSRLIESVVIGLNR